ncbi:ATP-binding cassette domain-containing protein [Bdellovibrio sp. SKB1291214]|uniref:ABC transporter ATP-binding protein n=1 Tax=Bdellovibrio sp. SKB1291214 TaxID=1732569 RepID=UPI000B517B89|nr:ATP-binding cassette domain-containing protein [Bdellovibrio sp. SKB1291214]UYL08396.1 ATP-binding cassette domain-containing protein [Bdellovibrio sp. SKB1291214]
MELCLKNITTPFFKIKDLQISSGERVLIKGQSGTGKTTLLHLLAGLYPPHSGEVLWAGTPISGCNENEISHRRKNAMALVFQNLNLLPYLTALENLQLVGLDSRLSQEMLKLVGLENKALLRTQSLSLGEQQRIAVARVLGQKPSVILADEPTSSLDDHNSEQIMKLLMDQQSSPSIIMVSHDHRVEKYFTRVLDMKEITQ